MIMTCYLVGTGKEEVIAYIKYCSRIRPKNLWKSNLRSTQTVAEFGFETGFFLSTSRGPHRHVRLLGLVEVEGGLSNGFSSNCVALPRRFP
jgi:hypothetical protein